MQAKPTKDDKYIYFENREINNNNNFFQQKKKEDSKVIAMYDRLGNTFPSGF